MLALLMSSFTWTGLRGGAATGDADLLIRSAHELLVLDCPKDLVEMRNSTSAYCTNVTDELQFRESFKLSTSQFFQIPIKSACPSGSRLAAVADAQNTDACSVLGKWDITKLEDGTISGSGYKCKTMKGDTRDTKNQLCMHTSQMPKFYRVHAASCPATMQPATTSMCQGGDCCKVLKQWDIAALADGSISGSGYKCLIIPGDPRRAALVDRVCIRQYSKEFEDYIINFQKQYRDDDEKAERYLVFQESQARIAKLNALNGDSPVPAFEWKKTLPGAPGSGSSCLLSGCIYDTKYCTRMTIGNISNQCAIAMSEVQEKCGAWDKCAGVICDPRVTFKFCVARGAISTEVAVRKNVFAYTKSSIASKFFKPAFGLTFTSDRFEHEKSKRGRKGYGNKIASSTLANVLQDFPGSVPNNVDWRLTRAVTPVKNQGQCGSCWAFSTAETVESAYFLSKVGADVPILFSPQQVASCVTTMDGCGGGDTAVAFTYLQGEKYGLAPASFWEYAQGLTPANTCSAKSCTQKCSSHNLKTTVTDAFYIGPSAHVKSFSYATPTCSGSCASQDLGKLASSLAQKGPVSICVNAGAWDDYVGGVMTAEACGGFAYDDLDHCVQLVGFNTTAPKPYWIVRNSWATSWGEEGYIYLEYSKNTCGLANEAILPEIEADSAPAEIEARMKEMRKLAVRN